MHWQKEGSDPDYRFSLANERTFLAWIRTALAVLAGAILLHQVATGLSPRWVLVATSTGLACVTAVLGGLAYQRWRANEIAMRHSRPLPASPLMALLAITAFVLGAGWAGYLLVNS